MSSYTENSRSGLRHPVCPLVLSGELASAAQSGDPPIQRLAIIAVSSGGNLTLEARSRAHILTISVLLSSTSVAGSLCDSRNGMIPVEELFKAKDTRASMGIFWNASLCSSTTALLKSHRSASLRKLSGIGGHSTLEN